MVTSRYGHYWATDLGSATVYISPGVPTGLLRSVVRHENAHVVSLARPAATFRPRSRQ